MLSIDPAAPGGWPPAPTVLASSSAVSSLNVGRRGIADTLPDFTATGIGTGS